MEINSFIFPAPKCEYNEQTFKELIWVPVYKPGKIKSPQSHQLVSPQVKRPSTQQDFRNDESDYDDVDENIEVHKSPPRLLQNYKTNELCNLQQKKHRLYESLANICVTTQSNDTIHHPRAIKTAIKQFKQDSPQLQTIRKIPCVFINNQSHQTLVYFHANGEDLYQAYDLMWHLGHQLNVNVFGIEYPGYGIYKAESKEETILQDADAVMHYLLHVRKIQESNILIFGRSIGSGPACYLASKFKPLILILVSPFLSIKQLVENKLGRLFSALIKERFPNHEFITQVRCPIFILHGHSDNIVPISHSLKLQRLCKCRCKLTTPYHMTHATFQLKQDLVYPLLKYMRN